MVFSVLYLHLVCLKQNRNKKNYSQKFHYLDIIKINLKNLNKILNTESQLTFVILVPRPSFHLWLRCASHISKIQKEVLGTRYKICWSLENSLFIYVSVVFSICQDLFCQLPRFSTGDLYLLVATDLYN